MTGRGSVEPSDALLKRKDEFLANITHELRTPMHGILSFSRFGMQRVQDAPREKLAHYFEQIHTSANRLMDLLNDLLDLSKSTAGKQHYVFHPHDLIDLLNGVVLEFNAAIREKGLAVHLERPVFSVVVECDGRKVRQVLSNLLTNAIKYSYPGGSLRYAFEQVVEPSDAGVDGVMLSLSDEGIGIPVGEEECIFEKFVQSSFSRTGAGGTGLGLAISREIMEAHGGRIWAEHNAAGRGSVFRLLLPVKQPAENKKETDHAPSAARG